ncbi:protein scabrous-like [Linepithema humile]|uniref:protein scabrous-like n=1 Tax=Linepithema humile TaxID=83485 RepID=UPI0006232E89|nr:PREDICTED: protein scabrous-like [Linepithema humile]
MANILWLLSAIIASTLTIGTCMDEDLSSTIKLLKEQVGALLEHRQEDYNALEESLKRAMEKNTELMVLKNEVKQLRKEVNALRGGSGNEAKNERLRVRWLGSAVTELQSEVAEVLRTRNASEELAERSRMRSELALLKGDVAEVGKSIRDLGGRITMIEATLGTIRLDIAATKERTSLISRSCADVSSQLSTVQIELKSLKCEQKPEHRPNKADIFHNEVRGSHEIGSIRRHSYYSHALSHRARLEDRLRNVERKISIVARKRAMVEKRVVFEDHEHLNERMKSLELAQTELSKKVSNASRDLVSMNELDESMVRLYDSVRLLEEAVYVNRSEVKRELARLEINAARKAAELSLTREELSNLRRAVQALSVSASQLQEKSDAQRKGLDILNETLSRLDLTQNLAKAVNVTHELEQVEDQYRLMVDSLPGNCEKRNGLTLLAPGPGAPLLASCHDGSIVVARRIDGAMDFDRSWNEYSIGFGSPVSEFWIGNEALHRLTRDNCSRLRVDLTDTYGVHWRAEYEHFTVDSEETGYRLHVSGYSGNATDALSYQDGMAFSAKDRDMDISTTDCAANYRGGWWFSHCQHANLNGRYSLGLTWFQSNTNEWMAVASSEMLVQRKQNC